MSAFLKKKNTNQPARRRVASGETDRSGAGRESQNHFKRGRTIAAGSYARQKSTNDKIHGDLSPREKAHRLHMARKKVTTILVCLLVFSVVLAALIWSFTATVLVSFSHQAQVPYQAEYEESIQEYLSRNPTERLRFNLDESHLTEFVSQQYPEVAQVTQEGFAGFAASDFVIELRSPVVSWQVGRTQYFVDKDGVSFERTVFDSPEVRVVDNSGVEYTAGTAIASARFLSFVGRAVAIAQQRGLEVSQVAIPAGTSRQVELLLKNVSYPLIFSIDRSPGEQVEDGLRAMKHFTESGRTPAYVDVRVKGRAFFREG